MKQLLFCCLALISISTFAQNKPAAKDEKKTITAPVLKNAADSFSYALGMLVGEQGFKSINANLFKRGLEDNAKGVKLMKTEDAQMCYQNYIQKMDTEKAAGEKTKGAAFLAENKKKPGVTALPNGLQYEVLKAGDPAGIKPKATDTVKVHYTGTLIDGTKFDSSVDRGEPATFPLNGVIRGWTEILQLMSVGSKWKVYIPSDLAYGDRGAGGVIKPGSTLIFEIDLLDVMPSK